MSISPIALNGMLQQSVDVSIIKQNQNQKPIFDQTLLAVQTDKKAKEDAEQVGGTEEKADVEGNFDPRKESHNKYEFMYDKKKKKKKKGTVKKIMPEHRFDIKI